MLLTGEKPVSSCDRKDQNISLKPPQEYNSKISDQVNRAIMHGMELERDKRPQTVQEWLDELGSSPISFKISIPIWKIPLWKVITGILSTLALFAALISGLKDGTDFLKDLDLFPKSSPTPTNSATKGDQVK